MNVKSSALSEILETDLKAYRNVGLRCLYLLEVPIEVLRRGGDSQSMISLTLCYCCTQKEDQ